MEPASEQVLSRVQKRDTSGCRSLPFMLLLLLSDSYMSEGTGV